MECFFPASHTPLLLLSVSCLDFDTNGESSYPSGWGRRELGTDRLRLLNLFYQGQTMKEGLLGAVFVGTEMQAFTANRNHAVSVESLRNLEFGTGEVLV